MSQLDIVYICNDAYMPMTGISIYSLLENNRAASQINIYLAGDHISPTNMEKLETLVKKYGRNLHMIDITGICQRLQEQGIKKYKGKTYSPYLKNLMTNEVDKDVERLLYIDSDTIIDGSLEELFSMNLDKPLYMIADVMWDFYKKKLGMDKDAPYYNGGIILYNIPVWKARGCYDRYWNFLKDSAKQYVLGDQDITNMLFSNADQQYSEIGTLRLKYNYFLKKECLYAAMREERCWCYQDSEIEDADKNGVVYHFSKYNGERPWEKGNSHPFREKYEYYKKKSPWSDTPPFERKISRIIHYQVMLKRILPDFLYTLVLRMAQRLYFYKSEKRINA